MTQERNVVRRRDTIAKQQRRKATGPNSRTMKPAWRSTWRVVTTPRIDIGHLAQHDLRRRQFIPAGIAAAPSRSSRPTPFLFPPRPRCPMKRALVLPVYLGLLAAACGNSSAGEAARTDATRLASSASPRLHRRPNHGPIPSFSS